MEQNRNMTTYSKNNMFEVNNTIYRKNKVSKDDQLAASQGEGYETLGDKNKRFAYNGENDQGNMETQNNMETVQLE